MSEQGFDIGERDYEGKPQRKLAIKSVWRAQAFRVIETILRRDAVLSGVVKTWRSREGFDTDYDLPAYDMYPMIALSPQPVPTELMSIDQIKINFSVSVQMFVHGSCVDDILGLWEAVEDAISINAEINGMPMLKYLCPIIKVPDGTTRTIMNLWPMVPAFAEVVLGKTGNDVTYQTGTGRLVCKILRNR